MLISFFALILAFALVGVARDAQSDCVTRCYQVAETTSNCLDENCECRCLCTSENFVGPLFECLDNNCTESEADTVRQLFGLVCRKSPPDVPDISTIPSNQNGTVSESGRETTSTTSPTHLPIGIQTRPTSVVTTKDRPTDKSDTAHPSQKPSGSSTTSSRTTVPTAPPTSPGPSSGGWFEFTFIAWILLLLDWVFGVLSYGFWMLPFPKLNISFSASGSVGWGVLRFFWPPSWFTSYHAEGKVPWSISIPMLSFQAVFFSSVLFFVLYGLYVSGVVPPRFEVPYIKWSVDLNAAFKFVVDIITRLRGFFAKFTFRVDDLFTFDFKRVWLAIWNAFAFMLLSVPKIWASCVGRFKSTSKPPRPPGKPTGELPPTETPHEYHWEIRCKTCGKPVKKCAYWQAKFPNFTIEPPMFVPPEGEESKALDRPKLTFKAS